MLGSVLVIPLKGDEVDAPENVPFASGERLTYSLRWGIVHVGEAILEILEPTDEFGEPAHTSDSELEQIILPINFIKVEQY